jgi:hypothetical protein
MNLWQLPRILNTTEASKVVEQPKERYIKLMFHQSGGDCDGYQPMCFEKGEFKTGGSDVKLREIAGCAFFMSRDNSTTGNIPSSSSGEAGKSFKFFAGNTPGYPFHHPFKNIYGGPGRAPVEVSAAG